MESYSTRIPKSQLKMFFFSKLKNLSKFGPALLLLFFFFSCFRITSDIHKTTTTIINEDSKTDISTRINKESKIEISTHNGKNNRNTLQTPFTFDWDMLDTSKNGTCGLMKCFFQAKSNKEHGFLVQYRNRNIIKEDNGWKRAVMLEKKYNISHFLLSPVQLIPVSKRLIHFADHYVGDYKTKSEKGLYPVADTKELIERSKSHVMSDVKHNFFGVQKVRTAAPEQHLEWGSKGQRRERCNKEFRAFKGGVRDKRQFRETMNVEIDNLFEMIVKENWLIPDIQVLIDNTGKIHHIDLDRDEPFLHDVGVSPHQTISWLVKKLREISHAVYDKHTDKSHRTYTPC